MDPALALEVAASSRQKVMYDAMALGDSEIQKFYSNTVIFITGGSGFLGKQLIEKLFRSCQISKVYMLLRSKKGKDIQQRLDEILKDPVFDILRLQQPNFSDNIVAVQGDVSENGLGINNERWKTITEEVDVIFHVAATTKFDETLRLATLINVKGTREALLLGKACKSLRSYVHVSTAYCHATTVLIGDEIKEKFYDAPVPPELMISMAENVNPERLISFTTGLIKDWPNTYTFTKSIAEELVRTMSVGLPICIVRPGIVLNPYREPLPGWLDVSCVYGASGMIGGVALGVLHSIPANFETKMGLVPCDFVNNAIIVAGRETATIQEKGGNDTKIYVVTSVQQNPVTWEMITHIVRSKGAEIPTPKAIYYNYAIITSRKWLNITLTLFLHMIPAYMADFICHLIGKEKRLVKIAKKVYAMCNTLSYFSINNWELLDDNLRTLYRGLSKQDRAIFNFDITSINWTEYVLLWCIGVRKYIIKDGLKDTEYALKKQRYLLIVHCLIITLYFYVIWKLLYLVFYVGSSLFSVLIKCK